MHLSYAEIVHNGVFIRHQFLFHCRARLTLPLQQATKLALYHHAFCSL
jgi:hypothetical protein